MQNGCVYIRPYIDDSIGFNKREKKKRIIRQEDEREGEKEIYKLKAN